MGATGAAGGVERIILAMKKYGIIKEKNTEDLTFIVYNSPEMLTMVERLASILRKKNKPVDYDLLGRSFSKQIIDAENKKVKNTIIFNSEEVKSSGNIILINNPDKNEKKINIVKSFDELFYEIQKTD
jgi:histidyl-tRNA synthetase